MTFGFNMWKFHRDERSARLDELCKAIWDTGALASDYWSKDFENQSDQSVQEAKILASQALIDGLYEDFAEYFAVDHPELVANFSELLDAISGGKFTEPGRPRDAERTSKAPRAAGVVIVTLRRIYRATIPFHNMGRAIRDNKRRVLDMPAL